MLTILFLCNRIEGFIARLQKPNDITKANDIISPVGNFPEEIQLMPLPGSRFVDEIWQKKNKLLSTIAVCLLLDFVEVKQNKYFYSLGVVSCVNYSL